ncbi:hypothetical protein CRP01_28005 [Flavilitoribacter nigricans DSM 23189 = NBRC 102662]|uniref:Lipocalin-like domain-containing protein n=2 Tax=Flavilitoribacter TaxID=2762562 RepID=A0A2D0N3Z5_FLAN2|nr:hypothetical protein CRP01_28005 [Flavilitoribacter nigricans DSM 23189 = NBRC 102662]
MLFFIPAPEQGAARYFKIYQIPNHFAPNLRLYLPANKIMMKKTHFVLVLSCLLMFACKKESSTTFPSDESMVGAWEIREITNVATGEVESFPEGPQGLIFNSSAYADAIEIRSNGNFATYYQSSGPHGTDRVDGTWTLLKNQTLKFDIQIGPGETILLPIIDLRADSLFLQDISNGEDIIYKLVR